MGGGGNQVWSFSFLFLFRKYVFENNTWLVACGDEVFIELEAGNECKYA